MSTGNQQDPHNYHQPSSPAISNHHLHGFTTLNLPQTPSSSSLPSTNTTETSTTPESRIAAVLGRAISNSKSTSFQDALTTTTTNTTTTNEQLARQLSDATSSATQYLSSTTPPKIPMQNVLRHANTDMITNERQEQPHARNRVRRAISDAVEYHHQQPPQKTRTPPPRVSSSPIATPESSVRKRSPQMEKMKKIEDMVKDFEQRCLDIIGQDEDDIPDPPKPKEQEECVGVDRLKNGDLRFVLSCACGKRFEMLLKNNGYCYHRLT